MTYKHLRRRMFDILERDSSEDWIADIVHYGLIVIILVSVVGAVLATVPSMNLSEERWFGLGEHLVLVIFTIEYVLRLWVAPEDPLRRRLPAWRARLHYAFTPTAIIDLIAILPVVVAQFTDLSIQTLLVLRLLRFFKLARYSSGFDALFTAVKHERHALFACLLILCGGVLLAATAVYLAERGAQPDKFSSIPQAMWWAITTLTTVGYGDMVPMTAAGRLIGSITMVGGLIMLALPIALISSSFSDVISKRDFVVTFSMISRMPLFADLDAQVLGDLLPVLNAHSFDRGRQVARPGETSKRLFVVLEGLVEAEMPDGAVCLGPGDIFGHAPGVDGTKVPDGVRALTKTKLLVLDDDALRILLLRYPEMKQRFADAAERKPTGAAERERLRNTRSLRRRLATRTPPSVKSSRPDKPGK